MGCITGESVMYIWEWCGEENHALRLTVKIGAEEEVGIPGMKGFSWAAPWWKLDGGGDRRSSLGAGEIGAWSGEFVGGGAGVRSKAEEWWLLIYTPVSVIRWSSWSRTFFSVSSVLQTDSIQSTVPAQKIWLGTSVHFYYILCFAF